MSEGNGCGLDVAAYALGALEPEEAEAFRSHLESCAICRAELDAMRAVVDVLPMSAPQYRAPRRLRRRVLAQIRTEPRAARGGQLRSARRALGSLGPRPVLAGATVLMACAAAAVAIALGSGPGTPRARIFPAAVGNAEVRITADRAELIVAHLPQPGRGKIYEVWVKHGRGAPQPTKALFGVTTGGQGDVVIPGSIRGVTAVMVTAEPAGGTSVPTSPPVVVASLT